MNNRVFKVTEHHLVELSVPYRSDSFRTIEWEVFIAVNGDDYRGKAIEVGGYKSTIGWLNIEEPEKGLEFMINAIEININRN